MDKDSVRIYLDLPSEILEELSDNDIDIEKILISEGIEAESFYASLPDSDPEIRTKDLCLVILTSATAVLLVGITINKLLTTILRRPQRVEYFEYYGTRCQ